MRTTHDMWKDTLLNLDFVDPLMKNTASSIEILNWSLFLIWIIGCISCLCGRTVRATPVILSYKRITGLAVGVILPSSSKLTRQKMLRSLILCSLLVLGAWAKPANECKEENAKYPDGNSCQGYYDCVQGELKHFQCPAMTFFDQGNLDKIKHTNLMKLRGY